MKGSRMKKSIIYIASYLILPSLCAATIKNTLNIHNNSSPKISDQKKAFTREATNKQKNVDFLHKAQIQQDELSLYVQQFIAQYVHQQESNGYQRSINTTDTSTDQEELQRITENVCSRLNQQLTNTNRTSIDRKQIDFLLLGQLNQTLRSQVVVYQPNEKLIKEVDASIYTLFEKSGLDLENIPSIMKTEFLNRKTSVLNKLQAMMEWQRTSQLTTQEINQTVQTTYQAFIERAQHVLLWNWAKSQFQKTSDDKISKHTPSSSLHSTKESIELRNKLTFLKDMLKK